MFRYDIKTLPGNLWKFLRFSTIHERIPFDRSEQMLHFVDEGTLMNLELTDVESFNIQEIFNVKFEGYGVYTVRWNVG